MKYRGVKINRPEFVSAVGVGPQLRAEITKGYAPIGMTYPDSLQGCKGTINRLIEKVCVGVGVPEKEAVRLINEN